MQPMPAPKFATPRNPARKTTGPAVGVIAGRMGTPFMPWQTLVSNVGNELDSRGHYFYPLVVISIQRQAGKTTLQLANSVHRCLSGPRRKVWMTAQTGQHAGEKFRELSEDFGQSPLKRFATTKRGKGSERMSFVNGSALRPHPPTEDSLHGEQSDLNNVDEGWKFTEPDALALMQAIVPTQTTRKGAQTVIVSTMGTAASTWFHGLCDAGREGAPGMAYFEWGIPDTADPTDLDMIAEHHPAFGHTVDMDALERAYAQMRKNPGEFARAYGNRRTGSRERVIPLTAWESAQTMEPIPEGLRLSFGAAVNVDGESAAIAVAALLPDGRPIVEMVTSKQGTMWVAGTLRKLAGEWQGNQVIVDRYGPSAVIADECDKLTVPLMDLQARDVALACADFLGRLKSMEENEFGIYVPRPRMLIRPNPALSTAADVAATRKFGDGGWMWSRRTSLGSIAELEAATLAVYGALHQPAEEAAPKIWTPGNA